MNAVEGFGVDQKRCALRVSLLGLLSTCTPTCLRHVPSYVDLFTSHHGDKLKIASLIHQPIYCTRVMASRKRLCLRAPNS